MRVTTKSSEQVWQSPDGKKTIWKVVLESDGKDYPLQTFSKEIAEVGFEGEVESYVNQRGDRFVKQPIAQNSGYGNYGKGGNAERAKADAQKQAEIRSEWSIGKAISSLGIFPLDEDALKKVRALAIELNKMVDEVIEASSKEGQ